MTEQVNKNQESELTEFNVHVFIPVRVKVCGIKAANAKEASRIAEELTTKEIAGLIDNDGVGLSCGNGATITEINYAQDTAIEFLADIAGDDDYERSAWVKPDEISGTQEQTSEPSM